MAIALTAWLMAPAPIACTSTRPLLLITPAIAPATATGLEVADTFSTSTGARSPVIAGTPSRMLSVDSLDGRCPASRTINGNQDRIECHGPCRDRETVWHPGHEPLKNGAFVHADAPVARPDHANVRDVGSAIRQHPGVRRRDVGMGAHNGACTSVQVPAHGGLFRGRLGVHVAEDDLDLRVSLQDGVRGAERVV